MLRPLQPVLAFVLVAVAGCGRVMYDPARATRPYPHDLHQASSIDIQVFREGLSIEIVNATPRSYRDFELWVNQRYMRHVDSMRAGETIRLSLWGFYDERGDRFSAGGVWRTEAPTPVRLVEIQLSDQDPLLGLVTIRAEADTD